MGHEVHKRHSGRSLDGVGDLRKLLLSSQSAAEGEFK